MYPQSGQTMCPPSLSGQYLTWSLKEAPRGYTLLQNGQACWALPTSADKKKVTLFLLIDQLKFYIVSFNIPIYFRSHNIYTLKIELPWDAS